MVINWQEAPEGTTHGMVNGGEMRWYRVVRGPDSVASETANGAGEHVECWHTKYREWIRSFFLSLDEVRDSGLYLYAYGEQSELVELRQQRDELLAAQTMGEQLNTPDFLDWIADRLVNAYGEPEQIDFVLSLRERARAGREAIAKTKGESA